MNDCSEIRIVTLTGPQRKLVGQLLPEFAERLGTIDRKPRQISFAVHELQRIFRALDTAEFNAADGSTLNVIDRVAGLVMKGISGITNVSEIPDTFRIYQFRIELCDTYPVIWRRIHVRDCSLDDLHCHIQMAMGWEMAHLYEFHINGDICKCSQSLGYRNKGGDENDATLARISSFLPESGERMRFHYTYDFGDEWLHEILFEGVLKAESGTKYPLCVDGEHDCPPEDIGGIHGFSFLQHALKSPRHEAYEEAQSMRRVMKANKFSTDRATKAMRKHS